MRRGDVSVAVTGDRHGIRRIRGNLGEDVPSNGIRDIIKDRVAYRELAFGRKTTSYTLRRAKSIIIEAHRGEPGKTSHDGE